MSQLEAVLALSLIAHDAMLAGMGQRKSTAKFAHGACRALPRGPAMFDSHRCSRYDTNTARLITPSAVRRFTAPLARDGEPAQPIVESATPIPSGISNHASFV